jgi:hypothetical protein
MADSKNAGLDFLRELRQERSELDALIHALEKRLGEPPTQSVSAPDGQPDSPEASSKRGRVVGHTRDAALASQQGPLTIGFFHNLSQAAAAEKLMRMNPNQALTTGQILEAFKNSGMPLNPKNAVQILYTALKRNPKFERVGNRAWGLREWYPEKKKRTNSDRMLPDPDNLPDHNSLEDIEAEDTKRNPA